MDGKVKLHYCKSAISDRWLVDLETLAFQHESTDVQSGVWWEQPKSFALIKGFYCLQVRCETTLLRFLKGMVWKIHVSKWANKRKKKACIEGVKKAFIGVTSEMASMGGGVGAGGGGSAHCRHSKSRHGVCSLLNSQVSPDLSGFIKKKNKKKTG